MSLHTYRLYARYAFKTAAYLWRWRKYAIVLAIVDKI